MQVFLIHPNVERDVLVHRIAVLRIMTDCILRGHSESSALLVEISGLLAKSVEMIGCHIDSGEMGQTTKLILLKGTLSQILVNDFSIQSLQGEIQRFLVDFKRTGLCGKYQFLLRLLARKIQRLNPHTLSFQKIVHPVFPRRRD